jgi:hypothetical protein
MPRLKVVVQTSPWLCCYYGTPNTVTARLVLPDYGRRIGQKKKKEQRPACGAVLFNQGNSNPTNSDQ